jgi:hypothetical protein
LKKFFTGEVNILFFCQERQQPVATKEEANGHSNRTLQSQQMKGKV